MTSLLENNENMGDELQRILKEKFGHQNYKNEIQRKAVEAVALGEHDVFVSMPTGAGKSLCYQLPAMSSKRNGVTVVISPLIALMMNQLQQMRLLGIPSETINSTMPKTERERVQNDLCSTKPITKLLYVTPEQAATSNFRAILDKMHSNENLVHIAVDEAHCVSQWGHDFRSDYLRLCEIRLKYPSVPWLALTATASPRIMDDALFLLKLRDPVIQFRTSTFRPNLYYDVVFKECIDDPYENLKNFALQALGKTWEDALPKNRGCGIIYCRTRAACEEIAMKLTKLGLVTKAYHAGMKSNERTLIQDEWTMGRVPVIAATISFGMGVDKPTVRFVIHWAVSQSLAAYYQESGRAGRDGKLSKCRIYYSRSDRESIMFLLKKDAKKAKSASNKLKGKNAIEGFNRIIKYCEEAVCRHMSLAKEFGDNIMKCEEHCDVCCKLQQVEKNLTRFRSTLLTSKVRHITSSNDNNDLYGGGRSGIKRENEECGSGSDEDEDHNKNAAKQLKIFINDEFERRRKSNKDKKLIIEDCCMVLKSDSKLIPEVTLDIRSMYLSKLQNELNMHYKSIKQTRVLNDQDLLDCAASHELHVFSTKGNIHMYRRDLIQLFRSLRDATKENNLHSLLAEYNPTQCVAKQEQKKEAKPKERLYTLLDLIPKREAKSVAIKDEENDSQCEDLVIDETNTMDKVNSSDSDASTYEKKYYWASDCRKQEKEVKTITSGSDTFSEEGNYNNSKSNNNLGLGFYQHSNSSSDDFDEKQDKVKQNYNALGQFTRTVPGSRPVIKYFFENPDLVETSESEQQQKNSDNLETVEEMDEIGQQQKNSSNFESVEGICKNEQQIQQQQESTNFEGNSVLKCERDPRKRRTNDNKLSNGKRKHSKSEKNHHKSSQDKTKNSAGLKLAADYVRKCLDPKYKKQKITKEMFKVACRKISHRLVESDTVSEEAAETAVKKLFCKHSMIKSEDDLIDV